MQNLIQTCLLFSPSSACQQDDKNAILAFPFKCDQQIKFQQLNLNANFNSNQNCDFSSLNSLENAIITQQNFLPLAIKNSIFNTSFDMKLHTEAKYQNVTFLSFPGFINCKKCSWRGGFGDISAGGKIANGNFVLDVTSEFPATLTIENSDFVLLGKVQDLVLVSSVGEIMDAGTVDIDGSQILIKGAVGKLTNEAASVILINQFQMKQTVIGSLENQGDLEININGTVKAADLSIIENLTNSHSILLSQNLTVEDLQVNSYFAIGSYTSADKSKDQLVISSNLTFSSYRGNKVNNILTAPINNITSQPDSKFVSYYNVSQKGTLNYQNFYCVSFAFQGEIKGEVSSFSNYSNFMSDVTASGISNNGQIMGKLYSKVFNKQEKFYFFIGESDNCNITINSCDNNSLLDVTEQGKWSGAMIPYTITEGVISLVIISRQQVEPVIGDQFACIGSCECTAKQVFDMQSLRCIEITNQTKKGLFISYVFWFVIAGLMLIALIVAAVVLSRNRVPLPEEKEQVLEETRQQLQPLKVTTKLTMSFNNELSVASSGNSQLISDQPPSLGKVNVPKQIPKPAQNVDLVSNGDEMDEANRYMQELYQNKSDL